jgi:hypothetical protein
MSSLLYDVLRPIPGPEGVIDKGQTVDVAGWRPRNVKQLVERRYLRPAAPRPDAQKGVGARAGKE